MSREEALEALNQRTRELQMAEGLHASAVLDAILAGGSQREVANWANISVNTVRAWMTAAGIKFAGQRYEVAS